MLPPQTWALPAPSALPGSGLPLSAGLHVRRSAAQGSPRSPCAESRGAVSRGARSCSMREPVACRSVGPAAARYVRAQGLLAGMTAREREIPGGGGAAMPWSRCQRRRFPETWRGARLWRKGKQTAEHAAVEREERAGQRGSLPCGARRLGSQGQGCAGAGSEPGFASPGALQPQPRSCGPVSLCPPSSPPGSAAARATGAAPLRPARRQLHGEGVTSGL